VLRSACTGCLCHQVTRSAPPTHPQAGGVSHTCMGAAPPLWRGRPGTPCRPPTPCMQHRTQWQQAQGNFSPSCAYPLSTQMPEGAVSRDAAVGGMNKGGFPVAALLLELLIMQPSFQYITSQSSQVVAPSLLPCPRHPGVVLIQQGQQVACWARAGDHAHSTRPVTCNCRGMCGFEMSVEAAAPSLCSAMASGGWCSTCG
jgi:hypothetical protein